MSTETYDKPKKSTGGKTRDGEESIASTATASKEVGKAKLGLEDNEVSRTNFSRVASQGSGEEGRGRTPDDKNKVKGRIVPGSLVLMSVAAFNLPNTEKGVFSKQVRRLNTSMPRDILYRLHVQDGTADLSCDELPEIDLTPRTFDVCIRDEVGFSGR